MDQNAFSSFIDEDRKRRLMQQQVAARAQPQSGGGSNGGQPMSARDVALALLPFGTILDKATTGQHVGLGDVALEAGLTFGPGKILKAAKLLKTGVKTAQAVKVGATAAEDAGAFGKAAAATKRVAGANVTPNGLKFTDNTAAELTPQAATLADQPADTIAKTSTRGRAVQKGNQALASQYGTIRTPVVRANNPAKVFGQLADIGITKPQDVERITSGITGSDGLLNHAVVKATGGAGRVSTDGVRQVVDDAINSNGLVDSQKKSIQQIIEAQMRRLEGGSGGAPKTLNPASTGVAGTRSAIQQGAHPSDVLGVMKDVEKQIAARTGRGETFSLPTPNSVSEANVLKAFHNELEDRLYNDAGANANVSKVLTPELRNNLLALHPGNTKWASYVDNTIMKSKDVASLRGAQKPFVQASRIMQDAELNAQTYGGRVGNAVGGTPTTPGGVAEKAINATINSNPAKRAKAAALRFVGGAEATPASEAATAATNAATVAARPSNPIVRGAQSLLGTVPGQPGKNVLRMEMRRGLGQSLVGGGQDMQQSSEALPPGTDGTLPSDPSQVDFSGGAQSPDTNTLAGGLTRDQILAGMEADLQTTGGKNISELKTMYDVASAGAGANAKVTANQQKQLQGAAAAQGIVQSIEQRLAELPGGRLAGALGKAEGALGLNDAVSSYEQNRPALALMLIKALQGSAGSISDADRNAIYGSIPSSSDTQGERKRKLAQLHTLIGVYQNSVNYAQDSSQQDANLPPNPADVQFAY